MSDADNCVMSIKVQRRERFGKDYVYPMCRVSRILIKLTKQKTWTEHDLELLRQAGIHIEYIPRCLSKEDI